MRFANNGIKVIIYVGTLTTVVTFMATIMYAAKQSRRFRLPDDGWSGKIAEKSGKSKLNWITVEKGKGVTLHSLLYFHPRPRSRSWPIKFSCLTPWPHQKSGLDPWLSCINHAYRSPGEPLTISKLPLIPTLTAWPASKFHLDRSTSLWPWSRVGVQSPILWPPPPWKGQVDLVEMNENEQENRKGRQDATIHFVA